MMMTATIAAVGVVLVTIGVTAGSLTAVFAGAFVLGMLAGLWFAAYLYETGKVSVAKRNRRPRKRMASIEALMVFLPKEARPPTHK